MPSPSAQTLTVGTFLGDWIAHMRGRVRPKTLDGYQGLIRLYALPSLGALRLAELAPLDIQRLYGELFGPERGLSGGTVVNLHLVLTQAFGQAERWGLIPKNPVAGAQPPRPRRPERAAVDAALAERLLAATEGTRFSLPVAIALATGMRRGEILALRWCDIDSDLSVARVRRTLQTAGGALLFVEPKTRRSRRAVELPEFVRPHLEWQRKERPGRIAASRRWAEHDLVIDRGDGRPVNPDTLSSAWYRFCKKEGFPGVRFHDLRHAHATLMLLQGVHPKVVSERLGHASIGITLDTYSHVLPSMQAEAVRAFDDLFPTNG
jgi:integrase